MENNIDISKEQNNRQRILQKGIEIKRVKRGKEGRGLGRIYMNNDNKFVYTPSSKFWFCFKGPKKVDLKDIVEIRQGTISSTKCQDISKTKKNGNISKALVDSACFSVIIMHPKFMCKAIEFMALNEAEKNKFCEALQHYVAEKTDQHLKFDEKVWLLNNFQKADINKNGLLSIDECLKLFKNLNLQCSEKYLKELFKQINSGPDRIEGKAWINKDEFLKLFDKLTERPDIRHILKMANNDSEEYLNVKQLTTFLKEEQGFCDVDEKKAEMIIDSFEIGNTQASPESEKLLYQPGFRRLLQSRWGNIMKPEHDIVFQDMTKPLSHYFINSSHNTYLTGLQVTGEASIEGYINALKRGARLLELDIFDGDKGEPIITHKRTLIKSINLRDTLHGIEKYAFQTSPYPVILTIENHVSLIQQQVMAKVFKQVLGDKLYIPPKNSASVGLPSPESLKYKFLLRGKRDDKQHMLSLNTNQDDPNLPKVEGNIDDEVYEREAALHSVDPEFGNIISLPSVKLSNNILKDKATHPKDGSPSLSETKVESYYDSGYQLPQYTATRVVKAYPKGIRQDSSNMDPMLAWLSGIQSVALNFQTNCENMDLNRGLFQVNGNSGYVLKPHFLIEGKDPRSQEVSQFVKTYMNVVIISGQYLPKVEPGNDIVDPYVSIEIYGIQQDKCKQKTKTIKNNGFNPYWNQSFTFPLYCPEMALVRFVVKDFDTTSTNDFVGEYTIPVTSIRPGYSHIRLNTGYGHTLDEAASIFVRIVFDNSQN
ncbi:C2 domain and Phospholipase C,phosphatidylinositol-specific, X domain and Phosphoinositide phospholipase C family and Phospholipase C, phosphatidylinositol-specific, Y domain and EF-hand domain and EF-hand domain pair and Pleckstrin homology-like domain and Phospholipase C,phosphoinositol-specific, EF-hand-like domain and PLC-like phosphodiesterase, TIM beta/alpha-barrel domain-containing protein [Strongyloides ratti]|uniref:Phosphoinositide phospholipase C n=1 Tax=Strongyloides ratti TaxID=34506 RepID=A0A090KZY4_STRRB|nr:C2 domain and Phospholipase C,phosphatidylinositol-specific, X domain and Phosphoinositide phospholipase C family and Phospholipase C, phosphatidylinositol-specific, Y domain and EF-hand domain and EF-hand domain pair and Pleckstrin homology-like domain and Phospholipase C,phosphoinositol-specific, EF-hand-like domain and PLC-like phosphodiesterase, TIM beta/alpha-barrel domain-containing protein [Strongyloides ratti]CEF61442.1 C2 domain and Phospholipase C,phosphatidylinositol-specific, X doma